MRYINIIKEIDANSIIKIVLPSYSNQIRRTCSLFPRPWFVRQSLTSCHLAVDKFHFNSLSLLPPSLCISSNFVKFHLCLPTRSSFVAEYFYWKVSKVVCNSPQFLQTYIHVHMYLHVPIYVYTSRYMHTYIHVYTYTYVYHV